MFLGEGYDLLANADWVTFRCFFLFFSWVSLDISLRNASLLTSEGTPDEVGSLQQMDRTGKHPQQIKATCRGGAGTCPEAAGRAGRATAEPGTRLR